MFSILTLSFASSALAVRYTCNSWVAATNQATYSAVGSAEVYDNATGAYFYLTGAQLKNGTDVSALPVVAHVHAADCATNDAGGHFKLNTTVNSTIQANELWASPNADGTQATQPASATWNGWGALAGASLAGRTDVKAIIIHEYTNATTAPKRVCCNLVLATDATTTTASVASTGASATAAANGTASTAAPGTTTGAAAASECKDAACCKALEDKKPACAGCLATKGCLYYGLFNNNVFTAGGKCVFDAGNSTVAPAGTYSKVDSAADCADRCDPLNCDTCLTTTGCVWCDTAKSAGDKVGVNLGSTGSCALKSCTTGVTPQTKCTGSASAAMLSVAAVAAVLVAML